MFNLKKTFFEGAQVLNELGRVRCRCADPFSLLLVAFHRNSAQVQGRIELPTIDLEGPAPYANMGSELFAVQPPMNQGWQAMAEQALDVWRKKSPHTSAQ
jgi:hypothetical protein